MVNPKNDLRYNLENTDTEKETTDTTYRDNRRQWLLRISTIIVIACVLFLCMEFFIFR